MALMNQRHVQLSGGNDKIALLLKAASVTTNAGKRRKPRIAVTVTAPRRRRSLCESMRAPSVPAQSFERAGGHGHQRQHCEREDESGDRQARREREIEARESELIHQVRDHVDAAAADQLRSSKCTEGPGERGGNARDDSGCGKRKCHGEEGADRSGAEARGGTFV